MPRDATGAFTRPVPPYQPHAQLKSAQMNAEMDGIAEALTASVPRDGSAGMTDDLPMGGNRVTGLGAPVDAADAVNLNYALGVPLGRVVNVGGVWPTTNYDPGDSEVAFFAFTLPASTRRLLLNINTQAFGLASGSEMIARIVITDGAGATLSRGGNPLLFDFSNLTNLNAFSGAGHHLRLEYSLADALPPGAAVSCRAYRKNGASTMRTYNVSGWAVT